MTAAADSRAADGGPWEVVEGILAARRPLALAVTGGGSRAVSWLLNHPGASRAVVEAQIPYSTAAIQEYLGVAGSHRAEEETARRLALKARQRAVRFTGDEGAIGAGATAALASDRQRRGEDRAHIAVRSPGAYLFAELRFEKGAADRLAQEEVLSAELVSSLATAIGTPCRASAELPPWAKRREAATAVDSAVEGLLAGEIDVVELTRPGAPAAAAVERQGRLLVPGSFHPFHRGHSGLAAVAEVRSGRRAAFELSVANVDKPPLPYRQVLQRADQPREGRALVLTREPTFLGKARLFPGCWFAIGYDTALRLVEPSYYGGAARGLQLALAELRDLGCRFLVAGRWWQGEFRGLAQVPVPAGFEDLMEEVPEWEFRADVSSTELRATGREAAP